MKMARALVFSILVCALLASPSSVLGQKKNYKLGVTGGYTSMTYGGQDASDAWEQRTGKSVGVVLVGIPSESFIRLQGEVRYVQKGARAEVPETNLTLRDRLHYFDTAFMGKLPLPISSAVAPHLLGGVSANVGLGGTREIEGPAGTVSEALRSSTQTQWALAFGAGIDIAPQSVVSLAADARYTYGLNGAPTNGIGGAEGAAFRNQGFMLNAAILIGF